MNEVYNLTCASCFHFREPAAGAQTGTCWRYPPIPVAIPVAAGQGTKIALPGGADSPIAGVMTVPVRPPVSGQTGACGEHELPEDDEPGFLGEREIEPRDNRPETDGA